MATAEENLAAAIQNLEESLILHRAMHEYGAILRECLATRNLDRVEAYSLLILSVQPGFVERKDEAMHRIQEFNLQLPEFRKSGKPVPDRIWDLVPKYEALVAQIPE
jgi:hypothetical protein